MLARAARLTDAALVGHARLGTLLVLLSVGFVLMPARGRATIEEQRARLPPPASCEDPVAGQWRAHVFYRHVQQWYVFVLDIGRAGDEQLVGTIHVDFWDGGELDAQPPDCRVAPRRGEVFEHASGSLVGLELRFEASDWRDEQVCGSIGGGYLLDRFSGTIDVERMEFQSLLNADAPEWRDVPTVFRRVRCSDGGGDEPSEPKVVVAPPPYEPPDDARGCGFR